jgi:hypothetical protein
MFSELNVEISSAKILKACNEVKLGKAAGPDLVFNDFFLKMGVKIFFFPILP